MSSKFQIASEKLRGKEICPGVNREDVIRFQCDLLVNIFGRSWFSSHLNRKTEHPAFKRWCLCQKLLEQGCRLRLPRDRSHLYDFADMVLAHQIISICSGGVLGRFDFGTFVDYGDEFVRRRIKDIIDNPIAFESLLTQFSFGACHKSKGHTVEPFEHDGAPDFRVSVPSLQLPIIADCKHIGRGASLNRYKKVVGKANSQIKALGEVGYGLVVIDATHQQKSIERPLSGDTMPQEIEQARLQIERVLQVSNSSVSAALLQWDSFVVLGNPRVATNGHAMERSGAVMFLRRFCEIIRHRRPITPLPEIGNAFNCAYSTWCELEFTD